MLIFMGPVYLLQAIVELSSGVSFFKDTNIGEGWLESYLNSLDDDPTITGLDVGLGISGFISVFLAPMAAGAIIIAIDHIRRGKEYTISLVIKQAFSRYGGMLGSTI